MAVYVDVRLNVTILLISRLTRHSSFFSGLGYHRCIMATEAAAKARMYDLAASRLLRPPLVLHSESLTAGSGR